MATANAKRYEVADRFRLILNHLYDTFGGTSPTTYKTAALAEALKISVPLADDHCLQLAELGLLTRTVQHGHFDASGVWKLGRVATWTLPLPREEGTAKLEDWLTKYLAGEVRQIEAIKQAKNIESRIDKKARVITLRERDMTDARNQPRVAPGGPIERVSVAKDPAEEVRAIAGPDKPSAFEALRPLRKADDATALIEAARQYANRAFTIDEQVAALQRSAKDLGLTIDVSALVGSIKFDRDERLETVALLLPVIDKLEARVDTLLQQMSAQKDKVRGYDAIADENRRLKARVEAMVSERVHTAQRAQA